MTYHARRVSTHEDTNRASPESTHRRLLVIFGHCRIVWAYQAGVAECRIALTQRSLQVVDHRIAELDVIGINVNFADVASTCDSGGEKERKIRKGV